MSLSQVQHVDQGIVQDLRNRKPAECAALVTCSPILNLKVHNKIFQNPVTVGLPVPQNPLRIKRPMTSLVRMKQGSEPNGRPQTAKPTPYNKDEGSCDVLSLKNNNPLSKYHILQS